MVERREVLVIGGGVAGLAAAVELSRAGISSALLEARDRLGGRILTLRRAASPPIELGAELVHGRLRWLQKRVPSATLETERVVESHSYLEHDGLVHEPNLGKILRRFAKSAERAGLADCSVSEAIARLDPPARQARLIRSFVSGLHAADPDRFAVDQLLEAKPSKKRPSGTKLWRVVGGYDRLIDGLVSELDPTAARVHTRAIVSEVSWSDRGVELTTRDGLGFSARRAIVTLPLGVLKAGSVRFSPALPSTEALAVGEVVRLVLELRSRFWPEDIGFLHGPELAIPTFWTQSPEAGPRLVGWASAAAARGLAGQSEAQIRAHAVASLAELFKMARVRVERELAELHYKDWQADPFSRGAYSYPVVGSHEPGSELRKPLADALYLAGEAFESEGATVAGALASGVRAARELIRRARPEARRDRRH